MTSIFEQLSGTYTQGRDGMLYPNLTLGDRKQRPIGRWGRIHRVYLETEHPGLYDRMILNGTLDRNLADAEERAQAMLEQLTRRMALQEGITENLKAADQMEWVCRMNSLKNPAGQQNSIRSIAQKSKHTKKHKLSTSITTANCRR